MKLLVLTIVWCLPAAFDCGPVATQTDDDTKLEWQRSARQVEPLLTGIADSVQELLIKPIEKAQEIFGQVLGPTNGLTSEPAVNATDETTEVPTKPPLVKPANGTASLVNSTTGGGHQLSTRAASLTDVAKQHVDSAASAIGQLVDAPNQLLAKTASLVSNPTDGAKQLLSGASILSDVAKQHVDSAASAIGQLVDAPNQLLAKTDSLVSNSTDGANKLLDRQASFMPGADFLSQAMGMFSGSSNGGQKPGSTDGGIGSLMSGVTGGGHDLSTRAANLTEALVNTTAEETNGLLHRSAGDLISNFKSSGRLIKKIIKLVRLAMAGNPVLKNVVDSLISSLKNQIPKKTNLQVVQEVEDEQGELYRKEEDTKEVHKDDSDESKQSSKNKENKEEDDVKPQKQKDIKGNNKQKKKKAKTADKLKKTGTKPVKKGDKKKKTNQKAEDKDGEDKENDDDDENGEDAGSEDVDEDKEKEDGEEDNEDEDAEEEE